MYGYIQNPETKSLGPDGQKRQAETRGRLWRNRIKGGLQIAIGKEIPRFDHGKGDFIENIDDSCIRYDGERVAGNACLIAEIKELGLRKATKRTGLDRKSIRAIVNGKKVKASTLAKIAFGLRPIVERPT